jgi:AP-3 complex subunit delta-1
MSCLDDPDVSIRLRALDLVVGMVNADNLTQIVDNLVQQLQNSPLDTNVDDLANDRGATAGVQPSSDWDDEDVSQSIKPAQKRNNQPPPIPDDYRFNIIQRILEMCNRNTYANVNDFDWYIDTLVVLVKHVPPPAITGKHDLAPISQDNVAANIGLELQNIAIRVKSARTEATRAAEMLLAVENRARLFPRSHNGGQGVLENVVWIAGEYAKHLQNPESTLDSLTQSTKQQLPPRILSGHVQAVIKVLTFILSDTGRSWTPERKTIISVTTAKVIHFLESLTTHPNLEVQERAVEYLELARLAADAASAHDASSHYGNIIEPPPLFTQALPALFGGVELNPVARDAQRKVPVPEGLDLDQPINANLVSLLSVGDLDLDVDLDDEFEIYYNQRPKTPIPSVASSEPAAARLQDAEVSYQQNNGDKADHEVAARRRADRHNRHKDDPFYIPSEDNSGTSTPYNVLRATNGENLDVDTIPIMELQIDDKTLQEQQAREAEARRKKRVPRKKIEILADEGIEDDNDMQVPIAPPSPSRSLRPPISTHNSHGRSASPLKLDSSGLGSFLLNPPAPRSNTATNQLDVERQEAEEAEMAAAMRQVERLRLEMQRKAETIEAPNGEGTVVKRKVKKKAAKDADQIGVASPRLDEEGKPKKKKKKKVKVEGDVDTPDAMSPAPMEREEPLLSLAAAAPDVVAGEDVKQQAKPGKKAKRRTVTFDND